MNRPDAILYGIAFYAYLAAFAMYILHVALKRDILGKLGTAAVAIGALPHTAAFFVRWHAQGHVPLANMYEYMGLMSWMVAVGLLYFVYRYKNHRIGVFVSPIAVVMMVVASLLPSEINRQLMPALQSTWLTIHVIMAALGSGAFLIAFAGAGLYLLTEDVESLKNYQEVQQRQWRLFGVFWIGVPVLTSLVLNVLGILPIPINHLPQSQMQLANTSAVTQFAVNLSGNPLFWGRAAIGLGIGLVIGAIAWPFAQHKFVPAPKDGPNPGARFFLVVVLGLLFGGIITGALVGAGTLQLTGRSYFKIFEFFGPTLLMSWVLIPILHVILVRTPTAWLSQLGMARPAFEEIAYTSVAIGYPLYTIGALFAGAIWAEQAWGTWWSWDPKEVGALIIWLFYTGFLHARYQRQWKGARAAVLVVLGMVFVFVSFFGNYFFGGLHSFEVSGG